jgi:pyruvate formate lyase activating enzyme
VNHYAPGLRILSMGNIGCMMNCSYCHNWRTSQAKYVKDADVHYYTPEAVVRTALSHGIRMLSWTYNDPVVWHEFVVETARLGKQHGLMNLYKSAFYITPEAVEELVPYIDIFSISLKSMDEEYYRKHTKGRLQPVLDATKCAFKSGRHVEVSTLMITDLSDNVQTAQSVASWVLTELDARVPMHFVRFHPDYRMTDTIRTPVERLVAARKTALEMGVEHVYLGNVYDTDASNTYCNECRLLLISRYGLNARVHGLDDDGCCTQCGRDAHVKHSRYARPPELALERDAGIAGDLKTFLWHDDIKSAHVQAKNTSAAPVVLCERRRLQDGSFKPWRMVRIAPGESFRFILAKSFAEESGCEIFIPNGIQSNMHEVLDRAHFPTESIGDVAAAVASAKKASWPLFED